MKPLRLRATNYRTFAELELELPAGCVGIVGDNGAGKSTIIGAVDLALFGPESRSLESYVSDDTIDGETMTLELELDHRGERYRVCRSYTRGGRGKSTCQFARLLVTETENGHGLTASTARAASWEPLTQGDQRDTQTLIEETLGITRDTFRASAFLAQGDGASFTEAQPRQRKEILADVLGLDVWDRARDLAAADKRERQQTIATLDGRIALLTERLAGFEALTEEISEWEDAATTAVMNEAAYARDAEAARETHQQLLDRDRAAAAARAALAAAKVELSALTRERETAMRAHADALKAGEEIERLRAQSNELSALTAELETMDEERRETARQREQAERLGAELYNVTQARRRAEADAQRVAGETEALQQKIGKVRSEPFPECPTCGQAVEKNARVRALEHLDAQRAELIAQQERAAAEAGELTEREKKLRADIAALPAVQESAESEQRYRSLTDRIEALHGVNERLAAAVERKAGLEATATLRETFNDELADAEQNVRQHTAELADAAGPEPEEIEAARAAQERTAAERAAAARAAETARVELAKARTRLEELERLADELTAAKSQQASLQRELDEIMLLERAFGRDGVPTWILETSAIPQLELHADELLRAFGTDYRVELRTQRERKTGGGTTDTLDVVLLTPTGERDYSTFSGGERTRLNLALRLALARLLAHRRGADCGLLAIDEPEFLDTAGTERLIDALRGLEGEYDTILLVSHVPALRDAFDRTIQVMKTDGRTEVMVA